MGNEIYHGNLPEGAKVNPEICQLVMQFWFQSGHALLRLRLKVRVQARMSKLFLPS